MNKHAKIDLPSRGVRDERQLFAAQLRAGRAVLGWGQTDLGERTGVTQRAIYRIEDGATRPRQLTRLRIETREAMWTVGQVAAKALYNFKKGNTQAPLLGLRPIAA